MLFRGLEGLDFAPNGFRGVLDTAAVDIHLKIGEAFFPQQGDGAQQDMHALVVVELAEIADAVARTGRANMGWRTSDFCPFVTQTIRSFGRPQAT